MAAPVMVMLDDFKTVYFSSSEHVRCSSLFSTLGNLVALTVHFGAVHEYQESL